MNTQTFSWKLMAQRVLSGALAASMPLLYLQPIDWRAVGLAALGGALGALGIDINAYKRQGNPAHSRPESPDLDGED